MSGKVKIIADSCFDLPVEFAEKSNVYVIPFPYILDEENYFDDLGQTVPYKDFYNKLREGSTSTTSQISAYTFKTTFKKFADEGYSIIYIGFSSGLSQTYNNALIAEKSLLEEDPSIDLTVVDSRCASSGEGLIVYYASEMLKAGKSKDEIVDWLEGNKYKMNHLFTVESLDYLRRGGRVSATSAAVGTLLDIKPLLIVDDDGKLAVVKKIRGRKKSIKTMLDIFREKVVNPEEQTIFIGHGDCLDDAEHLRDMLLREFKVKDVFINYLGPTIGSHVGPGMLCLIFLAENREID